MIEAIATFIEERSRLSFAGHRQKALARAVEERAAASQTPGPSAYLKRLKESHAEERALLELLTVNETTFFRNPGQFRFLAERIVPQLEARGGAGCGRAPGSAPGAPFVRGKVRILSAGCATGEEPYSVAMVLAAALRYPAAWDLEILAGDISERCLASARTGYFAKERLKGIPPFYAERYLERSGDGAVVKEEIRRQVRFSRLNLAELMAAPTFFREGMGDFDLILCRNVMIYFALPAQQRLVDTLFRLLRPGGYLFTGDAEPLHLFAHQFAQVPEAGCLVYQKEMR